MVRDSTRGDAASLPLSAFVSVPSDFRDPANLRQPSVRLFAFTGDVRKIRFGQLGRNRYEAPDGEAYVAVPLRTGKGTVSTLHVVPSTQARMHSRTATISLPDVVVSLKAMSFPEVAAGVIALTCFTRDFDPHQFVTTEAFAALPLTPEDRDTLISIAARRDLASGSDASEAVATAVAAPTLTVAQMAAVQMAAATLPAAARGASAVTMERPAKRQRVQHGVDVHTSLSALLELPGSDVAYPAAPATAFRAVARPAVDEQCAKEDYGPYRSLSQLMNGAASMTAVPGRSAPPSLSFQSPHVAVAHFSAPAAFAGYAVPAAAIASVPAPASVPDLSAPSLLTPPLPVASLPAVPLPPRASSTHGTAPLLAGQWDAAALVSSQRQRMRMPAEWTVERTPPGSLDKARPKWETALQP